MLNDILVGSDIEPIILDPEKYLRTAVLYCQDFIASGLDVPCTCSKEEHWYVVYRPNRKSRRTSSTPKIAALLCSGAYNFRINRKQWAYAVWAYRKRIRNA